MESRAPILDILLSVVDSGHKKRLATVKVRVRLIMGWCGWVVEIAVVEVERIIVVKVAAIRCHQASRWRRSSFEVAAIDVIKMTLIVV